ncbi:unnamed protein product [Auanema sp. JU1783]|nr:unnamed protein product [Auanema sp. JU1783]
MYILTSSIFLIISIIASIEAQGTNSGNETSFDVDTVLKAVGAPACMRRCIDPFMEKISEMWELEKIVERMSNVCSTYNETLECLDKSPACDVQSIFKTATLSFQKRCVEKADIYKRMEKCMIGRTDKVMQKCDSKCFCRSNATAFSSHPSIQMAAKMGGNIFIVNDHISGLCSCLKCAIPCVTFEMNLQCPLSGWLSLDVMLQPFDAVSSLLEVLSPEVQAIIRSKVSDQCHFAISSKSLKKVREGDFSVLAN